MPEKIDPWLNEFYRGLREAQEVILKIKPDLLVIPLRGAKPLHDFIRRLSESDGRLSEMPPYVEVPVGEVSAEIRGVRMGVSADDASGKTELMRGHVIPALADRGIDKPLVCILDEAISGGALVKNMQYVDAVLGESFPDSKVVAVVIGAEGNRGKDFGHLRSKGLIHEIVLANKFGRTSMLTLDRPEMLVQLQRTPEGKVVAVSNDEPPAARELGDRLVELDSGHRIEVPIKSKLLRNIQHWRGSSPGGRTPKHLRQIAENLWISGMPHSQDHVESIKGLGVRNVISFESMSHTMEGRFSKEDISVVEMPFHDEEVPPREVVTSFLELMSKHQGEGFLLHCRNGVGRAPTMATVYLIEQGVNISDIPAENIPLPARQREFLIKYAHDKKTRGVMDTAAQELERDMRAQMTRKLQKRTRHQA